MADVVDIAQEHEEHMRNLALAGHRPIKGVSLVYCIDCDDPIAQKRRIAAPGCTRCFSCAEDFELRIRK